MSSLAHRTFDDPTERPPLRLLERRARPAPVPAAPVQHPVDRWLDRWLVRWVDGYFAMGDKLQHRHRMGSWQSLR